MGKKLPYAKTSVNMAEETRTVFSGIDRSEGITDGAIYDTSNITSDYYPALGARPRRKILRSFDDKTVYGIGYSKELFYVAKKKGEDETWFYYKDEPYFEVSEGEKSFAVINGYICVFPDKMYFSETALEAKNIDSPYDDLEALHEATVNDSDNLKSGDIYIAEGKAFSYNPFGVWRDNLTSASDSKETPYSHQAQTEWIYLMECFGRLETNEVLIGERFESLDGLSGNGLAVIASEENGAYDTIIDFDYDDGLFGVKVGDAVDIVVTFRTTGTPYKKMRKTYSVVLKEVGTKKRYYTYLFSGLDIPEEITEAGTTYRRYRALINKTVPDFDIVFEHNNRLWGSSKGTIYASALGDPTVWNAYTSSASGAWAWNGGYAKSFTGGCSFDGYPTFFNENSIVKIGGDYPSEYATYETNNISGVKRGCEKSLASDGSYLYYVSSSGVMRYSGAFPVLISSKLGSEATCFELATAGAADGKYYLSSGSKTYIYDILKGMWLIEDKNKSFDMFMYKERELVGLSGDKAYVMNTHDTTQDDELENEFNSRIEFSPFFDGTLKKKGISKIVLNISMKSGGVFIAYDNEPFLLQWRRESNERKTYSVPLIIRRCEMYRIRIQGSDLKLYGITRIRYKGSEY